MSERKCVFAGVIFITPDLPTYRGESGVCLATGYGDLNTCCHNAARQLVLSDQKDKVSEAIESLESDRSLVARAQRLGLTTAE